MVGHCSGALDLDVLAPHEAFRVHSLMTVTHAGTSFEGAGAALAGNTPAALDFAHALAAKLGLRVVEIADDDRAAYHAAATVASNFLVTLEDAAETLLHTTGADRRLLVPLVRAAVENWAALGGPQALTGPIARGDDANARPLQNEPPRCSRSSTRCATQPEPSPPADPAESSVCVRRETGQRCLGQPAAGGPGR